MKKLMIQHQIIIKKKNLKENSLNENDNNNNNNNNNNDNNSNINSRNDKKPYYNKKLNKKYNCDDEENSKSYGRRKIFDNSYRYEEPTYEEQLEAEAEIDVAVEDALSLINSQENNTNYDPSSYFQFKKENWINNEEFSEKDDKIQEIFNIDFNKLDKSLKNVSIWDRIKINKDFIIDNNDNGCVNEPNKINKIIPSYNYIRNDSISLNPNFNFNIPTESISSNNEVKENNNESNNSKVNINNDVKHEINTEYDKQNKSNITTSKSSKPIDDLTFDIDELIKDTKPINQKKETEIDDELDMLLSLDTTKSNDNNKTNNNNDLFNNLNNLTNTPMNKNDNNSNSNSKNNQNMENLQDWLDDLLS